MKKRWGLVVVLVLVFLAILGQIVAAQSSDPVAVSLLRRFNEWRVEQGLSPLKPNSVLDELAAFQADYLASLPEIDVERIHRDAQDRNPRERAVEAPFNWPHYALDDRVAISEIAAVGTINSAIGFWQTSPVHTRASLNPGYREVGIAVRQLRRDTLFIMVLGSRPNVLPAFVMPDGNLFLTSEQYQWSAGDAYIQKPTRYQIFNADGIPMTLGWRPWQDRIAIPDSVTDSVFVLSSDGVRDVLSEVNLTLDRAILPGVELAFLPTPTPAASPTPSATFTPSYTPTLTPSPTFTPSPTRTGPTDTPSPTFTPSMTFTPTNTPTATFTPTVTPTNTLTPTPEPIPELAIYYNSRQLVIHNISGQRLDISQLSLQGSGDPLLITAFTRAFPAPIDRFPADNCLQVYPFTGTPVTAPSVCNQVNAVLNVSPSRVFWTAGDFTVQLNGRTLATCPVGGEECLVDLDQ